MFDKERVKDLNREYRQSFSSIEALVELQNEILSGKDERFIVNTEKTEYIAEGLLVLLGTLPELSKKNKTDVRIRYRTPSKFAEKIIESGLLTYYKGNGRQQTLPPEEKKICFCRPESLEEYLDIVGKIMQMAPVTFDSGAYATMSSKLYEVFDNAMTHGKNEIGVFSYGSVQRNQFVFSVYDLGIGIQKNVNNFTEKNFDTKQAMEWALESGNSTKKVDYPRGAGFTLLESFVHVNNGTMFLCSDDMICKITKSGRAFYKMKHRMLGTLLVMSIRSDRSSVYSIRR